MAVDYKKDVLPFEEAGMTDAEIAFHLSSRTARPIPCGEAKIVLEETDTVYEDPVTGTRYGSLVDTYSSLPSGDSKALVAWFITHVFGRGEQISSDSAPRAVQLASVLSGLGPAFADVGAAILALGGGQPQAGTTEQDVANARAEYEAQQLRVAAYADIQRKSGAALAAAEAAMNAGQTPAEITAAAETAWSA